MIIKHIKNARLNLFLRRFSLFSENEINIEINKRIAPTGNAEGRKNIPNKKKMLPNAKKS